MIVGIGTDICDARRIEKSINNFDERFVERIFTKAEIDAASARSTRSLYFAKRFAAKEAIYKALNASGVEGRGWRDAEILNDEGGAPTVRLSGRCKTALEALTPDGYKAKLDLSISDEPPYVVAFVVLSISPV